MSDCVQVLSRASNVISYKQLGDGDRVLADAAYLALEAAASATSTDECDVSLGPKESMNFTRTLRAYTVPLLCTGTFDVSRLGAALGGRSNGSVGVVCISGTQHLRYIPPPGFAPAGKLSIAQTAQVALAIVFAGFIAYSPPVLQLIRSLPNF